MAAYRPLAVLASIWIGLLAIALLAFAQLTHNAANEPGSLPSDQASGVYPHERMLQDAEVGVPPQEADAAEARDSVSATPDSLEDQTVNGLSVWTLAALVGSCAGGCWLLSVLLTMPRRPKKRRPKSAGQRKKYRLAPRPGQAPTPPSATPQPQAETGPKKLDAYDPEQPLVPPSQAPQTTMPTTPATQSSAPAAAAPVSIVSDQVQHRLDWPSDSLVNTADVRQRRSLSSYL